MTLRSTERSYVRLTTCVATLAALMLFAPAAEALPQQLDGDHLKDGSRVRRAFRTVVAGPSRATVRILSRGKQVALGAIVDARGYVLTKASELDGRLSCRLKDGRELDARVVSIFDGYDLAMLKIDAEDLTPVQWRDGADPAVGQWLATPGTGDVPVAVGVVSVRRRNIPMPRAILGVTIADDRFGARITHVFPDSGADKAGLKPGDVITAIEGTAIDGADALSETVRKHHPGETIGLRVLRPDADEETELEATLGSPHSNPRSRGYIQNHMGGHLSERRFGFPAVLQHDTVLRPQDCGGPVVDLAGRVVGLNIARAGRVESYALPAEKILPLIEAMKAGQFAPKPQLVEIQAPAGPQEME